MVTIRYRFGCRTISYLAKNEADRKSFVSALQTLGIPILTQQLVLALEGPCRQK